MMATAQENAATARRGYEAFSSGDMQALAEVIAEDVVWHCAGRGRLAGDKRGRDATFAYFGQLAELTGGTFRVELHDLTASDDHIAGIQTVTGERAGRSLNLREALVFHLRDGKIVEAWEQMADTQTWDEFFA
jgi:ketosteroid isomerase-like protein